VGEPILLRLTLTGAGNLRLVDAPEVRDIPGWRVLPRGSDVLTEVVDGVAQGTRTFDYVLIPGEVGTVTLPPLELSYFDPATGEYRVAQTLPLVLEAVENPALPAAQAVLTTTTAAPPELPTPEPLPADVAAVAPRLASGLPVLALLPAPERVPLQQPPLTSSRLFWALWALPALAMVLGAGAYRSSRSGARQARQANRARAGAGREILRRLPPPAAFETPAGAVAAADGALLEYLERKLGRPVKGMALPALAALLVEAGAPAPLAQRVLECLRAGEQARYSAVEIDRSAAAELHGDVVACIRELDEVLA
jgi:hypothetical protein